MKYAPKYVPVENPNKKSFFCAPGREEKLLPHNKHNFIL
jgi:hypothetical protein